MERLKVGTDYDPDFDFDAKKRKFMGPDVTVRERPSAQADWSEDDRRHRESKQKTKKKKSNITIPHFRIPKEFLNDMTDPIKSTPLGLYWFLRRYCWDAQHPKDIFNLYTKYYIKQGLLASTYSMPKLAEIFGRSVSTIQEWIKLLHKKGWLQYGEKMGRDGQNTYIMGVIDDKGEQRFFADDLPRNR